MAYVDITVAMKDESMRRQVLESALKELETWKETYQGYVEFMPVITAIGLVRDSLQRSGSLVGEKA